MAVFSPLAAFCLFAAGMMLQLMASDNSPDPVFKRKKDEAAIFLGKDNYGMPVLLPIGQIMRHGMLIGTTGPGKTTGNSSITDSIMRMGGGFCFTDGKPDATDTREVHY